MNQAILPPRRSGSSETYDVARCARWLTKGAALELYLTPKPGLVDLADAGSHGDLSLPMMEQSVLLIGDYLDSLCRCLRSGGDLPELRKIGLNAEKLMLDRFGTNTHRGYIFLSGLLLTACFRCGTIGERAVREEVRSLAERFFHPDVMPDSNGAAARALYGTGGIVNESLHGFPSLFDAALPVYRELLQEKGAEIPASFAMLGCLMTAVDDTTAMHRCGRRGLDRLRRDGERLLTAVRSGGNYIGLLRSLNEDYRAMNLTMGGVADLLALGLGYLGMTETNTSRQLASGYAGD